MAVVEQLDLFSKKVVEASVKEQYNDEDFNLGPKKLTAKLCDILINDLQFRELDQEAFLNQTTMKLRKVGIVDNWRYIWTVNLFSKEYDIAPTDAPNVVLMLVTEGYQLLGKVRSYPKRKELYSRLNMWEEFLCGCSKESKRQQDYFHSGEQFYSSSKDFTKLANDFSVVEKIIQLQRGVWR